MYLYVLIHVFLKTIFLTPSNMIPFLFLFWGGGEKRNKPLFIFNEIKFVCFLYSIVGASKLKSAKLWAYSQLLTQFHKTLFTKHYTQQSDIEHSCPFLKHCPSKCKPSVSVPKEDIGCDAVVLLWQSQIGSWEGSYGLLLCIKYFIHCILLTYYKILCMMFFFTEHFEILYW